MNKDSIVIASAIRTALGRYMGSLSSVPAPHLGAHVLGRAVQQANVPADLIDEVFMGCVLPAGQGQAPARQAARKAGLPDSVGATTVNKVCGSGMKAVMLAHDLVRAGSATIVAAGGMESMSSAPYLLPGARQGYRAGHHTVADHVMLDGLEDAYDRQPMGGYGDRTAAAYDFSREDQDKFAIDSLLWARRAVEDGSFVNEIAPIEVPAKGGAVTVECDESPMAVKPEKIPTLRPAFSVDGTVTAATSSGNADGAAALIVTSAGAAAQHDMPVLGRVVGHATHSQEPAWFTTAPIGAIKKLLDKVEWSVGDVDLWEINEAFAVVAMAAMKDLGLPRDTVNVNGGACALGHPIGATGARIIVTLLHAMERRNVKRGVACLCIGGGEATAIALERRF